MSTFITLEGPEGSGKSTQICRLIRRLESHGIRSVQTREPGGTSIGDQVRSILMDLANKAMDPTTEILLFSASRAQHVHEFIKPLLEQGIVVVSDRYYHSTLAYQGYGHGLDLDTLQQITRFATGGLDPDLILLLDVPSKAGLHRRRTDGNWNRLDDYTLAFHQRVRQGYLTMAADDPRHWAVIDASRSLDEVEEAIWQVVSEKLGL
ncbi:MAG: dTMP kinase [Anaerolineales bacterium]|nr:dTMP kinase [Anaerolineales bacterium]